MKLEPGLGPGVRALMREPDGSQPHFCTPLAEPRWVAAADAAHMRPDDPVLGLEFGAGAWALPWWIMKNHHIANLELAGRAVLVTLCEACSSGAAFDPVIGGRRHHFRLDGLYNGTIMPVDLDSGSNWTGFTGEAISGPLKGTVMERLPLLQGTWAEWLGQRPDTLVPDGAGESRVGHGEGHFPGGPVVAPRFRALLPHLDPRLPHYELVLGVAAGGEERCYALAALGGALNERLGGVEIAIFSRPGTWLAGAYERTLEGRTLSFAARGAQIVDEQTGSAWTLSGRALSGPLAGRSLRYVHSGVEEFHIWAAFHPKTGVWGAPGAAGAAWSGDDVPKVVLKALEKQWWTRGMRLLEVGCGAGLAAAWIAESNLRVLGVDADAALVARARASFGRLPGLEFAVADLARAEGGAPLPAAAFDALLDRGTFAALDAAGREAYAARVAAAARPGARFLLLAPAAKDEREAALAGLRAPLAAHFHLVDAGGVMLPAAAGAPRAALALRLVRRGWLDQKR